METKILNNLLVNIRNTNSIWISEVESSYSENWITGSFKIHYEYIAPKDLNDECHMYTEWEKIEFTIREKHKEIDLQFTHDVNEFYKDFFLEDVDFTLFYEMMPLLQFLGRFKADEFKVLKTTIENPKYFEDNSILRFKYDLISKETEIDNILANKQDEWAYFSENFDIHFSPAGYWKCKGCGEVIDEEIRSMYRHWIICKEEHKENTREARLYV